MAARVAAVRQRFALAEKERRLQDLRDEHAKRYSRKFVPAGAEWSASQVADMTRIKTDHTMYLNMI